MNPKAKRIGIFDDEEGLVVGLKFFLKEQVNSDGEQIEADICSKGRSCEEFCNIFRPDLALLDLLWEGQDITFSDIENVLKAKRIPIVFISGKIKPRTASLTKQKVIVRPKEPEEIFAQLSKWRLV